MNLLWDKALDFLVSTIGEAVVDSWRKNSEVDKDLSFLCAALPKAQLLIERAECWRLPKYNPIDKYLFLLKDSVYEAQSILDELQYQILKHKVETSIPVVIYQKIPTNLANLEYVPSKEAAQKDELNNKPFINYLDLGWKSDVLLSDEVLEGLCPHHNLKDLSISGYGGRNLSPSWLKEEFLPNLITVKFYNCKVSTISHLPCFITKLVITTCSQLENLQNLLEPNHLPELKHIEIRSCKNLESLSVESFGRFELLEQLIITMCPKLSSPNPMVLPPSVKLLLLDDCGDIENSIPSCLQNLTSLETLSISQCQHLVSIPAEVTSNLKSLSRLDLYNCVELQSLGGLQNIKSLSTLNLVRCDNLQSLGGLQFLASLQEVYIQFCPKLDETRGRNIKGKVPSGLLKDRKRTRKGQKMTLAPE